MKHQKERQKPLELDIGILLPKLTSAAFATAQGLVSAGANEQVTSGEPSCKNPSTNSFQLSLTCDFCWDG
jgi:hypothetical protein